MLLRNMFLGSASFLSRPDDEGAGGAGADDKTVDAGAAGEQGSDDTTGATEGDGAGENGDGAGEGDDGSEGDGEAEDDPFVGLTEEQKAKLRRHLDKEVGWRDRQINRLTAKRRSAEEDVRAAQTIVERQPAAALPPEEVQRAAAQLRVQETYNEACNSTDAAGRKHYKDKWNDLTTKLKQMGGVPADDMADIVLGTDHPEVVLASLAQDPDNYERIMGLPPAKRRSEFVKLGLKPPPAAKTSSPDSKRPADLPAPPRNINASRNAASAQRVDLYKDDVADDLWYQQRNETRRKKFTNV